MKTGIHYAALLMCIMVSSLVMASIPTGGWYTSFQAEPEHVAQHVMLSGQIISSQLFQSTIASLQEVCIYHPEIFQQFMSHCASGTIAQLPPDIISGLQDLQLVQPDATVSTVVQSVMTVSVEQQDNGGFKILALEELIKNGSVTQA